MCSHAEFDNSMIGLPANLALIKNKQFADKIEQ